jgi:hypothetical protein
MVPGVQRCSVRSSIHAAHNRESLVEREKALSGCRFIRSSFLGDKRSKGLRVRVNGSAAGEFVVRGDGLRSLEVSLRLPRGSEQPVNRDHPARRQTRQ